MLAHVLNCFGTLHDSRSKCEGSQGVSERDTTSASCLELRLADRIHERRVPFSSGGGYAGGQFSKSSFKTFHRLGNPLGTLDGLGRSFRTLPEFDPGVRQSPNAEERTRHIVVF